MQDQREQFAALVTAPRNRRFAQVIVNRMWHRYLGRGLVETTVLQPAALANGVAAKRVTQLSDDSLVTELALEDKPLAEFIDSVYRAVLTRPATSEERELFRELLADGYNSRRVDAPVVKPHPPKNTGVTWSNHLRPEASDRKLALAKKLESGDPPT